MARFGANDVVVRRRPRRWPIAAAAVAIPIVSMALDNYGLTAGIVFAEALLFFMLPALAIESAPVGEKKIDVLHADHDGVSFGERLVVRRDDVAATAIEPLADGRHALQLWGTRAKDDLTILLADAERAEKMQAALGLDADRHAACFTVESASLRAPKRQRMLSALRFAGAAAIIAATCLFTWHHELFGFALVPFLFMYFALLRFLRFRRRITLGQDALVIDSPVQINEIERVESGALDMNASVHKRDGTRVDLRFEGAEKRDAFVTRLQKSLLHPGGGHAAHVASLVAPATRTRAAWLEDLRKLGTATFRGATVPTEDLWRIVEHPGADAGARAGAAAALVPHLDAEARVRIGELADGTANTELRAALQAAAEADATDEQVLAAYMDER